MVKNFKSHQKKWSDFANIWKNVTKPGRPSKQDLKNYSRLVKNSIKDISSNPKIVILGSTPEFREMFFKNKNLQVLCVDMTKEVYKAMTELVRNHNPKEKFIKVNWLNISKKIKPEYADLIIGDYVINNVGGFEDKFFKEIVKILKPGGFFITRQQIGSKNIKKVTNMFSELKRLTGKARRRELTCKEAANCFADNIILHTWHLNNNSKISLSYIKNDIRKLEKDVSNSSDRVLKKVFNIYKITYGAIEDKYWIDLTKAKIEKIMKKYFKVRKILYSHDYEIAKFSPIYCLEKNKN